MSLSPCPWIAQIRLAIILTHATLETALAFMNHFPLFAVMLRLKDPSRLPGDSLIGSLPSYYYLTRVVSIQVVFFLF